MPGLVPRLSGTIHASCCLLHCGGTTTSCAATMRSSRSISPEIKYSLLGLRYLEKFGDGSSMHEIRFDEPCKSEWARNDSVRVMSQAQQQKSDKGNHNLNANGVLGGSEEVSNLQCLFHPPKEQLDRPTPLVQVGDFLRARGQIIGEDAQHLTGLDHDADFAHAVRHRVVSRSGKPLWKISDPITQDRRRSCWHRALLDNLKRRIAFEPRDNVAAGPMQLRPPAIIVITEVENVGCARLNRHLLRCRDIIYVRRGDHQIEWLIGIRIVDDVRFGAANSRRKRRPVAAQAAQLYAGRIDQTHTIADFPPISSLQLSHQRREQSCEHFGGPQSIAGRERRPRYGAAPKMIKLVGMALQARFDLAQTSCAEKLGVQHRDQMRLGLQNSVIPIGIVLLHKMIESRPRDEFQNRMKDDILVSHGLGPYSCPVDSQVTGIE